MIVDGEDAYRGVARSRHVMLQLRADSMPVGQGAEHFEPRPDAARCGLRISVRHCRRYAQVYLGPGSRFTPDLELRAELFRPLPHSDQAKVARLSACIQYRRADPLSIVTDSDVQRLVVVGHF